MAMPKIDKRIEIVRSPLPALSSMGQKSAGMIQRILEQHYTTVTTSLVGSITDLEAVAARQPRIMASTSRTALP